MQRANIDYNLIYEKIIDQDDITDFSSRCKNDM